MVMLHDLEVQALLADRQAEASHQALRQWAELEDEQEQERQSLRRWLANAFIQIGVKIDPLAADELGSVEKSS